MRRRSHEFNEYVEESYYSDDPYYEEALPPQRSKKFGFLALLITAGFFIQNTLAANITLGPNGPGEFGQGIQVSAACSGSTPLTIKPNLTFDNTSSKFMLSSIQVTGIPSSCQGADFTLKGFGETSSASLAMFNSTSTDAVIYDNSGTFQVGAGGYGLTVTSGANQFTVNFLQPVLISTSLARITIQSSSHAPVACDLGGICALGNTGPGGGKVFYISNDGFACGPTLAAICHYMELAPYPWGGNADPTRTFAQSTPVNYQSTNVGNAGGDTASATAIGWGYRNTLAIIAQGNTDPTKAAAPMARTYTPTVNGVQYTDWFLPTEEEALMVYTNKNAAGLTYNSWFWTSTTAASTTGRIVKNDTLPAFAADLGKGVNAQVRPVRAF